MCGTLLIFVWWHVQWNYAYCLYFVCLTVNLINYCDILYMFVCNMVFCCPFRTIWCVCCLLVCRNMLQHLLQTLQMFQLLAAVLEKVWEAMVYPMTLIHFQAKFLGALLVQSLLFTVQGVFSYQANISWVLLWSLTRRLLCPNLKLTCMALSWGWQIAMSTRSKLCSLNSSSLFCIGD